MKQTVCRCTCRKSIPEGEAVGDESKGCRRRYRKAYATKGKEKRRNLIRKSEVFLFYSQLYSQHVIIILVGNKSWVKEHTNGY